MEHAFGAGMGILAFLVVAAGLGLLIGALARLVLPGPDPMSWPATLGFGLLGSVAGGLVSRLVRVPPLTDLAIAVGCAALLIWFFRRRHGTARRSETRPPLE